MSKKNEAEAPSEQTPDVVETPAEKSKKTKPRNADLDLKQFNYHASGGFMLENYLEYISTIDANEKRDFECYSVEPLIKDRYPGMKDTPRDFVGIKLKSDKPVQTTSIPLKHAINLNAEGSVRMNGKYYLLKK